MKTGAVFHAGIETVNTGTNLLVNLNFGKQEKADEYFTG